MEDRKDTLEEVKELLHSIIEDIYEEGVFDVFESYPQQLPSFDELVSIIDDIYFK